MRVTQTIPEGAAAFALHAIAVATGAGFAEDLAEAIALDPGVTDRRSLDRALAEAREIRDLAAFAAERYSWLNEMYDLSGVAHDFIRRRIPVARFRHDIAARLAELDEHIDTAPPAKKPNAAGDALAAEVWAKRNDKGGNK